MGCCPQCPRASSVNSAPSSSPPSSGTVSSAGFGGFGLCRPDARLLGTLLGGELPPMPASSLPRLSLPSFPSAASFPFPVPFPASSARSSSCARVVRPAVRTGAQTAKAPDKSSLVGVTSSISNFTLPTSDTTFANAYDNPHGPVNLAGRSRFNSIQSMDGDSRLANGNLMETSVDHLLDH